METEILTLNDIETIEHEFQVYNKTEYNEEFDSLSQLFSYNLQKQDDIGLPITKYNGAKRFDVMRDPKSCVVKNPVKFINVIKYIEKISNQTPSHGIKIKEKSSAPILVHLLVEYDNGNAIGVFYFDSKRTLSVTQIHQVERAVLAAKLTGALIICNKVGVPAADEAQRINQSYGNHGIINIQRYDSIRNELGLN